MIILAKPYVSEFLIETIKKNNFPVLNNEISDKYLDNKYLISDKEAIEKYQKGELFYTNSESSIDWIAENLKNSKLSDLIEICKNKTLFRKTISKIYPKYHFREIRLDELKKINIETLNFPFILKPSVGFLSFGVYPINNKSDWQNVLSKIDDDINKLKNIFSSSVVNMTNFIMEDMIFGDEFAIDAYYNNNGEAVILNIFHHPFFDDKDVSDRAYYTNKEIFEKYYDKFKNILNKISKCADFKNFPFHLELRVDNENIIPIEMNPLRFCGWCITDIAYYAWNINPYEYYLKQKKPDWKNILKDKNNDYYYFTIGDIPSVIKPNGIDYENYIKNIKNPLSIRKIDYKNNPIFAVVFAKTDSLDEIKNILKLDMKKFCI
jgi:hypothetical protein